MPAYGNHSPHDERLVLMSTRGWDIRLLHSPPAGGERPCRVWQGWFRYGIWFNSITLVIGRAICVGCVLGFLSVSDEVEAGFPVPGGGVGVYGELRWAGRGSEDFAEEVFCAGS